MPQTSWAAHTIISHGDVGNDLLQHDLALDTFLILTVCCLELCPEFLLSQFNYASDLKPNIMANLDLAAGEELGILAF
jgi:hypothetical protein